jgi:hypothetical protein
MKISFPPAGVIDLVGKGVTIVDPCRSAAVAPRHGDRFGDYNEDRKMSQIGKVCGVAAAAMTLGSVASADSITMTFLGFGASQTTGISYNASRAWDGRSVSSFTNITAGAHRFGVYSQERVTFCAQLFEGVTVGNTYTFDYTDVANVPDSPPAPGAMGAIKATLVSDLYRRYYSGLSTAQDNAAFQIALYEITHENLSAADAASALAQLDLTRGAFQTSASADAFQSAADMLASLGEGGFKSVGNNLRGLTNATAQDQLLMVPVGGPAILAGLGLLGVGVLRRRMK